VFDQLRRLFKHSLVYGMAETVSRGTGFILLFIYGIVLTKDDIGLRSAVYVASAFLGIFYTLGLDNAFLRYFMDDELAEKKAELFSSAFFFSMLTGFFFLVFALFNSETISLILTKYPTYDYIIRLLFIIMIFDTVVIYPTQVLRAENRLLYFSLVAFTRFFLFILLNLFFVWRLKRGLKGIFEANLIVVFTIAVLLLPVFLKYLRGRISFSILKKMLTFGIPTIFTILCMRVIDFSDRQVINYLLGETALGEYSVAYNLGMVGVMVFINSFRIAWQPFFLSEKNYPNAREMFSRVATYYAMIIGMVFLGITLFREEIFTLFVAYFKSEYPLSLSKIVPLVSLAYMFFGFYIIMMAGIFIREKTRYLPIVTFIAAALNVGLNFIFVPVFGTIGAAYTTVIAYFAMVLVMYLISMNIYRVNYEFKRLGLVMLFTAVPIGLSLIFTPDGKVMRLLYHGVLLFVPVIGYISTGFILQEERIRLKQILKNLINRMEK